MHHHKIQHHTLYFFPGLPSLLAFQTTRFMPDLLIHLLPGAVGGISLVLVGHPFDLVKVRLQTSPVPSLKHCLMEIIRGRGFRGFYQGVTVPLLGVMPVFGMYYGTFKIGRDFLDKHDGDLGLLNSGHCWSLCSNNHHTCGLSSRETQNNLTGGSSLTNPQASMVSSTLTQRLYLSGGLRSHVQWSILDASKGHSQFHHLFF